MERGLNAAQNPSRRELLARIADLEGACERLAVFADCIAPSVPDSMYVTEMGRPKDQDPRVPEPTARDLRTLSTILRRSWWGGAA